MLIQHMGLGLAGLGRDTAQGLDEVVLAGQLEHAFLQRWQQGGTQGQRPQRTGLSSPRAPASPSKPLRSHYPPPNTNGHPHEGQPAVPLS